MTHAARSTLLALALTLLPATLFAQATSGLELELHGLSTAVAGRPLRLRGVAYGVTGVATLGPLPRARVTATLPIASDDDDDDDAADGQSRRAPPAVATVTSDDAGRFTLELTVPDVSPRQRTLTLDVAAGGRHRTFEQPIEIVARYTLDVLTDRNLYEPGETVHVWARLLDGTTGAPIEHQPVELQIGDARAVAGPSRSATVVSSAGGVATLDAPVPANSGEQSTRVTVGVPALGLVAETRVRVGRRTVEPMRAEVHVDNPLVVPGARVTGTVTVRAASGVPVADARVRVALAADSPRDVAQSTDARTDAHGVARFALRAAAYAPGATTGARLEVTAQHPGYGSVRASGSFVIARAPWSVAAVAQNAALVPDTHAWAYLVVSDPLGEPPPAGLRIAVTGVAVDAPRSVFRGTTDAHGIVAVPMHARRGDAAPHEQGDCDGSDATSFDVDTESGTPFHARVCVPVSRFANIVLRVARPAATAGDAIDVAVERAGHAAGHDVLVDVLGAVSDATPASLIATARLAPGVARTRITLPAGWLGVVRVCARPAVAGASAEGSGACDALLVRPAHAFAVTLAPERAVYHPRETARVGVHLPAGLAGVSLALVARDLSAHGGESAFALAWQRAALDEAVVDPTTPDAERLIRVALIASLAVDTPAVLAPPLVPGEPDPDAEASDASAYDDGAATARGDLRDPFARGDVLVRTGLATVMTALEAAIESSERDGAPGVVRAGGVRGFDAAAIAHLVDAGELDEDAARSLGGEVLTVAMLEASRPVGFSFERAARRVARKQLVQLLAAVSVAADPGDGSRSTLRGQPPERWLSRMVQTGALERGALDDPWGHAFALRPTHGARAPVVAIAALAPGWELVSPGPDGALGTADDVRDPFERVVPAGTAYAVASGEDELMRALAALDPGEDVLTRIAAAYTRVSEAAQEEAVGDAASAGDSTGDAFGAGEMGMAAHGTGAGGGGIGLGSIGTIGHGSGTGFGRGYGSAAALGALVRERFPATLLFVGERSADASGTTWFELPLADALTTYRVEVIAWSRDGWTATASTEVHVDQDAVVDAPVPPFASVGDVLRVPLRLSNRSAHPIDARLEVTSEGALALTLPGVVRVHAAPGETVEAVVEVVARAAGEGRLVVRATDASGARVLDAVRRPMRVTASGRAVRMDAEAVVASRGELTLNVPADATSPGGGVVRITSGAALFGASDDWSAWANDPSYPAWARASANAPLGEALVDRVAATLRVSRGANERDAAATELLARATAETLARTTGALWAHAATPDAALERALLAITRGLPEARREPRRAADVLLGLAPAVTHANARPALEATLRAVVALERAAVGSGTALVTDDATDPLAIASAALFLTGHAAASEARAREYLRRASRALVRGAGGQASIDDASGVDPGSSAALALALAASGARRDALALLTTLARASGEGHALRWDDRGRALAVAALARLVPASAATSLVVAVDGRDATVALERGTGALDSARLATPGVHRITVRASDGTVLLARVRARYARAWTAPPPARGPFVLALEGSVGARDGRAQLVLRVRNHGPRLIAAPRIEIELPAGAELDVAARAEIARRTGHAASIDGRTLVLRPRALAPGAQTRVPLAIHWTVGGRLTGLGVAAYASSALGAAATLLAAAPLDVPDAAPR